MKKVFSFVKEVSARITGDNATVTAEKNYRKASSILNSQIATLKAALVDNEGTLENAQETLANAMYPTNLITDNKSYLQGIVNAQSGVESAQASLDATKASIAYWEGITASFNKEVE